METRAVRFWLILAIALAPFAAHADDSPDRARYEALIAGDPSARISSVEEHGALIDLLDGPHVIGDVRLSSVSPPWIVPRFTTRSFYVSLQAHAPGEEVSTKLVRLAHLIDQHDDGKLGFPPHSVMPTTPPTDLWEFALGLAALAALAAIVWRKKVTWELRLPHLLPGAIQMALLLYWSVYWPGVNSQWSSIAAQLVLAYALDALFSLAVTRQWRIGAGPIPVVLSANLFAWFQVWGALALVTAAIASRFLIRWKGKHIFNPSAFGLTFALALSLIFPQTFPLTGLFSMLNAPPNMAELLLVLALLPQIRFRIVLVTIGAVLGLVLGKYLMSNVPSIGWPGTLIVVTLFLTDPATGSKTPLGQLLFGLCVGLGIGVVTWAGYALGAGDDRLSKILPVVLANAAVPLFDWIGRVSERWTPFLAPKWNLAHVVVWLVLVIPHVAADKPDLFNAAMHWTYGTPLVARDKDDVPRCSDNPTFCRPFTFVSELGLWAKHLAH